jgi:hypothetical protein
MLDRRLQLLIDRERHVRLTEVAREWGVSVAAVVREAIGRALGPDPVRRKAAGRRLLNAPDMELGVAELKPELDRLRGRRACSESEQPDLYCA